MRSGEGAAGRRAWFAALLLVAVAARLYHFGAPPYDSHEFRQTQTLTLTASYARGAPWLQPLVYWYGLKPRTAVLELPLYSIANYLMAHLTGISLLVAGRMLSFLLSLAAIAVFYLLCLAREHPHPRAATVLFAFAPLAIFYGHAVQPEPLMLLAMLVAAFAAVRACAGRAAWWSALAALALATAAAIKPTALVILGPPIAYDAWRTRRWARGGLILGAAAIGMLAWAAYDRSILLDLNPSWYEVNSARLLGPISDLTDTVYWRTLAERFAFLALPPLFVGVVAARAVVREADRYWWAWLLGGLVSLVVFSRLNIEHTYYQLPFTPGLAALVAYGVSWPRRAITQVGAALLLVTSSLVAAGDLFQTNPVYYDAGSAAGAATRPGEGVIAMSGYGGRVLEFPTILYYADRPGWNVSPYASDEELAALPACTLVIANDEGQYQRTPPGWVVVLRGLDYTLERRTGCPGTLGG